MPSVSSIEARMLMIWVIKFNYCYPGIHIYVRSVDGEMLFVPNRINLL